MNNKIPLKRFGQHYLRDDNIVSKIITEISPQSSDTILEIGPGEGVLTSKLINDVKDLVAVEIDKRNCALLSEKYAGLNLINADFLKINLYEIYNNCQSKLRIIGNIPYNITSPILFKIIENRKIIRDSVLMIQYDVAKRIIAQPGNREYGILSVILKHFTDVKLCFKVSPNVFHPRPKVFSAVIHLIIKDTMQSDFFDQTFIKIVKAAFGNRRKMLSNSFKNSIFEALNFSETGIDLTKRAEQLTIDDFIKLTKFALHRVDINNLDKSF